MGSGRREEDVEGLGRGGGEMVGLIGRAVNEDKLERG